MNPYETNETELQIQAMKDGLREAHRVQAIARRIEEQRQGIPRVRPVTITTITVR